MKEKQYHLFETLLYTILWIVVFTAPFFFIEEMPGRPHHQRMRLLHEILKILPLFLIFILNNSFFFEFFRRRKYILYFALTLATIILLSYLLTKSQYFFDLFNLPGPPMRRARALMIATNSILFNNIILSVLVVGFNDAIKIGINWMVDRKNYEQLQKENLRTQLAYLKHQVSPHFFMNTLNNIHALIDLEKEKAKEAVVKLSNLMRVLLYETDAEKINLQKEIIFIKDYIELMKMRVDRNVDIRFDYPENIPSVQIPPLLFISFIENAFKHGIRATGKSFIHVSYHLPDTDTLEVKVKNSKTKKMNPENHERIGLNNSGKRLELLYKNHHRYEINDGLDTFEVLIQIPLS